MGEKKTKNTIKMFETKEKTIILFLVIFHLTMVMICVPLQEQKQELQKSTISSISFLGPKVILPKDDPLSQWEDVQVHSGDLLELENLLQQDASVTPSTISSLTCSIEKGCLCRHQSYYKHLDVTGCDVIAPQPYFKSDFRCQFFSQGGYLFLYGDSWVKLSNPKNDQGDTYYCKADPIPSK
eukprot:c8365_g1_i1.p1 GENE.c8365_g1_i1~~c8365_g1_i1.p1  ORF type:complete len:182 (+),score=65.09 c8365_g1_i1:2-547(+)